MLRETPPGLDAYDPGNLLIFASSVVAGLDGPGLARCSVITKSPLSGGISESTCEGPWGHYLKGSGYDALVIRGRAKSPVYLLLRQGEVHFVDAHYLWGRDTYSTILMLEEEYGEDIQVAAIGQAGENLVRYASIVNAYSFQARRLGTGAVMGSKNLKAVVLQGKSLPPVCDAERLAGIKADFDRQVNSNMLSNNQNQPPGFAAWLAMADRETAYYSVNNYRQNLWPPSASDQYSKAEFNQYYRGDLVCPGCSINCIKSIDPDDSYRRSSGIHQEVAGSAGPNIGNDNLKVMLEINRLCNLYGLDPGSLGFTISFAQECYEQGLLTTKDTGGMELTFANQQDLPGLVRDIAIRQGIGDLLAEGSRRAAEQIGRGAERYAMQVKGVELPPFEPRSQTCLALGYAVAPVGPSYVICEHDYDYDTEVGWEYCLEELHPLGILHFMPMEGLNPEKVKMFKQLNHLWSGLDALNICLYASTPTRVMTMKMITELITAVTGWTTGSFELMNWGERKNHLMRLYNLREGITAAADTLPERFFNEAITEGRFKGLKLEKEAFQQAVQLYYQMMGWDEDGVPLPGKLYEQQLGWAVQDHHTFR